MEAGESRRVSFGKRAGSDRTQARAARCAHPPIPRWGSRWSGTATGRWLESEAGRWLARARPQPCGFPLEVVHVLQHRRRGQFAQSEQDELGRLGLSQLQFAADLDQLLIAEHRPRGFSFTDYQRHPRASGDSELQSQAIGSQRTRPAKFDKELAEWTQVGGTRAHPSKTNYLHSRSVFFIEKRNRAT